MNLKKTLSLCVVALFAFACSKAPDIDKGKYPASPDDDAIVSVKSSGNGAKTLLRLKPSEGRYYRFKSGINGSRQKVAGL